MTARSIALLLAAALLGATTVASAQGRFYPVGTSALMVGVNTFESGDITGDGASAGISLGGSLDIGLGYGESSMDDATYGELSVTAFTPSLTMHPLRESRRMPVSCTMSIQYTIPSYSGAPLDTLDADLKGSNTGFRVMVHRTFRPVSFCRLIPYVSASYATSRFQFTQDGETNTREDDTTTLGLGFSATVSTGARTLLILTPGMAVGGDNTTYSLSLDFAAPLSR